jgi:hypothetical protein
VIKIHQDGGNRGRPQSLLAPNLPRTALSAANAAESPTATMARREMQSWRLLQLEPLSASLTYSPRRRSFRKTVRTFQPRCITWHIPPFDAARQLQIRMPGRSEYTARWPIDFRNSSTTFGRLVLIEMNSVNC